MKKLFFLLCACLMCTLASNAQNREALEDSVIVGGISHSMIEMVFCMTIVAKCKNEKNIILEMVQILQQFIHCLTLWIQVLNLKII